MTELNISPIFNFAFLILQQTSKKPGFCVSPIPFREQLKQLNPYH
jgi:hypothetical protein